MVRKRQLHQMVPSSGPLSGNSRKTWRPKPLVSKWKRVGDGVGGEVLCTWLIWVPCRSVVHNF